MKILNQWSTEREGNDTWLKYNLSIIQEWSELTIQLKENHSGWGGDVRETRSTVLDPDNVTDEMFSRVYDYIDDYCESGINDNKERDEMLVTIANVMLKLNKEMSFKFLEYIEKRENPS